MEIFHLVPVLEQDIATMTRSKSEKNIHIRPLSNDNVLQKPVRTNIACVYQYTTDDTPPPPFRLRHCFGLNCNFKLSCRQLAFAFTGFSWSRWYIEIHYLIPLTFYLQIIIDNDRNIRYVHSGFPGHMNDAGVYALLPRIGAGRGA